MTVDQKVGVTAEQIIKRYKLKAIKKEGLEKSIGTLVSFGYVPRVSDKSLVLQHPQKDAMIVSSFDDVGASMLVGYSLGVIDAGR
jgi:hypothetical protein